MYLRKLHRTTWRLWKCCMDCTSTSSPDCCYQEGLQTCKVWWEAAVQVIEPPVGMHTYGTRSLVQYSPAQGCAYLWSILSGTLQLFLLILFVFFFVAYIHPGESHDDYTWGRPSPWVQKSHYMASRQMYHDQVLIQKHSMPWSGWACTFTILNHWGEGEWMASNNRPIISHSIYPVQTTCRWGRGVLIVGPWESRFLVDIKYTASYTLIARACSPSYIRKGERERGLM